MSLEIKVEEDDRKFLAGVKKMLLPWIIALIIGFCMGKIYTWDTTITDCKVLGVFRIANTAFQCKMMVP